MDGYSGKNRESIKIFIYRFLQRLFLEPDEEFINFLLQKSEALKEIGIELDDGIDLETLQTEYTRLFLGPAEHLPPYESVFLERRFWGTPTNDIQDFIRSMGLELKKDFNMPPDHVSIEFEILEKILSSKDPEINAQYMDFLKEHIVWIFDFLTRLIPKTDLKFYQTAFAFSKVFLKAEMSCGSLAVEERWR